jgi:RNA polymerase sigma factor (sigma-70 family)
MSYDTRAVDLFLGENGVTGQGESQEAEISFLLQNARPDDPRILTLLIERYGPEIQRLVQALLKLSPGDQAERATAQVFAAAGENIQGFWGDSGPRRWLFGLAIRHTHDLLRQRERKSSPYTPDQAELEGVSRTPTSQDGLETDLSAEIDRLPESLRLVLVLRYLFGLSLQDIADLLNEKVDKVDFELFCARSRLHAIFPVGQRLYFKKHPERFRQIEDYRNGLLDHEVAIHTGLVQHVSECEHCFAYADDLVECEDTLVRALRHRWPLAPLELAVQVRLEEGARAIMDQPQRRRFSVIPLRQILWTGGILLALVAGAWYLFRSGMDAELPVTNPGPASRQSTRQIPARSNLPEPLDIPAAILSEPAAEVGEGSIYNYVYHMEPILSGDGSMVAFSSTGNFLRDTSPSGTMDVYFYDLSAGSVEQVAPGDNRFPRWRMSPSISENGRWVVYSSNELEESDQGYYDFSNTGIYLFDRESGERKRIDVAFDGSSPVGASFAPSISAGGRWIAFWSTSSNLVSEDREACTPQGEEPLSCLDAFIHDHESGITTRVPIGRNAEFLFSYDRLEISADGRWITFNIYETDRLSNEIGLTNPAGAYLFDREAWVFTRVDVSNDGIPGDQMAGATSVSTDGRFAAFISWAGNLAPGDDRSGADVFVRDLVEGVTERVTGGENGVLGFEYPEGYYPASAGWGNTVDLSTDGRFVSFLGRWERQSGDESVRCPSIMGTGVCNEVFVFDRENGRVEQVTIPGSKRLYLFPEISDDGRWVTYIEMLPSCEPLSDRQVCTEVWLYDRENDWTYPVTKGRYSLPEATQLPVSNLNTGRGPVTQLAFSPDGEILATATRSNTILLWRSETGGAMGVLRSSSEANITGLAFSPDGELLAAGLSDGRVDVWRLSDRFNLYNLDGLPGAILQVAFFVDGRLVARTAKAIWIWQQPGDTFIRTKKWEFDPGTVMGMAISPQKDWIATAEADDLVWLREATSGEVLLRLRGHVEGLRRVALSPDGSYLAAVWRGGQVDVWQIEESGEGMLSADYLRTLFHPDEVLNLAFASDGDHLATVAGTGKLLMWNVETGVSFRPFYPHSGYNGVLAFSQDRMAAGVSTGLEQGEVYLAYMWKGFSSEDAPRFFEQGATDGDLPLGSIPSYRTREPGQGYTYIGKEILFNDLYQADRATPYEIKAPIYLPPGFQFRLAQVYPTGAVSLHYDYFERPDDPPTASLLILQHPDTPGFPGYTVGASALIQGVEIGGLPGEYVRGEWQSFTFGETDQGRFAWHWDSQSASQRLRWKDGEQIYAIHYRPLRTGGIEERYTNKTDLLDIAEKMAPLGQPTSPNYLLSASIVRDEHGCLVSATRSGRPVESRAMSGLGQSGDCQLVFDDRNLQEQRLAFAEIDLNCDGQAERMEIQVIPGGQEAPPSFQIVLMVPSSTGLYQPAWSTTIPDSGQDLVALVEVRSSGGCERTLALDVSQGDETFSQVLRWDGKDMQPVNEGEGLFDYGHDALPP